MTWKLTHAAIKHQIDSRQEEANKEQFIMALYKYFKSSKTSKTLATEQNNLSKRENERDWWITKCGRKQWKTTKVSRVDTNSESRVSKHTAEHGNTSTVRAMSI